MITYGFDEFTFHFFISMVTEPESNTCFLLNGALTKINTPSMVLS